ncbi:transglycosylase domain-containing protein [Salinibacillus xinjiangensis]|uniref:PBP1A family penicillin-binding protein n=1 Tax=Salinibacillus xinjiangensis TaxID=1229268 RepID=A0A6G1X7U6_9BACI|nr:PBP1A family penicillin-binding protein [Salinibacillus xinjiangensis]MRG86950.1 PBP1A family penicillin-binding protein [Salinibacillus xinjiangensis]
MKQRSGKHNASKKHPALKWGGILILSTLLLGVIGYLIIIIGGKMVVDDRGFVFSEATVIETAEGVEVATLYSENRTFIPIDQIPKHVQNAFIAIEDQRFYEHAGVDMVSVGRALYKDILALEKVEGASTITQQLVKNLFLTNDKSWLRKTKEVMGAIYLERTLSKPKILEYYLNEIYFGHGVYGIEKAAQFYFGKSVSELTLSEGAMLAAIPKSPTHYSPIDHPEQVKERRNLVLASMQDLNMIDAQEMTSLQGRTTEINQGEQVERPWIESYVDLVLKEMEDKYHISAKEVYRGGYKIVTGINPTIQKVAYEHFQNDQYFNGSTEGMEGVFILMDQETGAIVAALGGRQFERGDLNRVFVKRQPGSIFKPLAVYGPALETGDYHPYSLLVDEKLTYGETYTPENFNDVYEGRVSMYDAVKDSKNATAVWLLNEMGVPFAKQYLSSMGMKIPDKNLSIALGGLTEGITPLDMVKAYRAFAHKGSTVEPYTILKVKNRDDEILEKAEIQEKEVFHPQTAWNMTKMLQAVVKSGTGSSGNFPKALAGKTGSTEHPHHPKAYKDVWFTGYTPQFVGAVWMGYDRTDEDHYVKSGSRMPTELMKDILTEVDKEQNLASHFKQPDNVHDLPDPISLPEITDLHAEKTFGFFKGVSAKLTWTPVEDERVVYHVYQRTNDGSERIGTVEGQGEFQDFDLRMFDEKTYYVIPYNPLTKQEGKRSNEVTLD